jgi:hypothetical protein
MCLYLATDDLPPAVNENPFATHHIAAIQFASTISIAPVCLQVRAGQSILIVDDHD